MGKLVHVTARGSTSPEGRAARRGRLGWMLLAVLLGTQTVVAGATAISNQSPFSEYLTQARRCVELDDCPSLGGRTGALPLFHGASWIRLLAYSLRAGGDQTPIQWFILGTWIVSVPLTFGLLLRYAGLPAAAVVIGLYFPVILVGTDITDFTYTNLLPLPWAVYFCGLALLVEFRSMLAGAIASVALAAAVSAELGSVVMVPFHLLLVALTCPRPALAVLVCGLAVAVPFSVESTDAAIEIARQVPTARFAIGLALSATAVAVAARIFPRTLFAAESPVAERMGAVMIGALIYATVTMFAACILLMDALPAPRYFLPASFPFLYLVAAAMSSVATRTALVVAGLESLGLLLLPAAPHALKLLQAPVMFVITLYAAALIVRRLRGGGILRPGRAPWAAIAICFFAIALAAADRIVHAARGAPQSFTLAEAEQVVAGLYATGRTYPELLASLHGPAVDQLMPLLTERDPDRFREPPPALHPGGVSSLLLLKVANAAIAQTQGVRLSVPAGGETTAIVVESGPSYLDWVRMRRCQWVVDGPGPAAYVCAEPRMDRPLRRNWPFVEFGDPTPRPGVPPADAPLGAPNVRYEVPVRTPGGGVPHVVRTSNEWPATWRIARVSGVEFEGNLPGPEIRLPDRQAGSGIVEFEFVGALPGDLPWVWRPNVIEVADANAHLLDGLRGGQ